MSEKYDQEFVVAWCRRHYPGETRMQMLRNLIEEVGELACEMDADPADLVTVLEKSMARGKEGTVAAIRGEIADVQISIHNLADDLGQDSQACLDEKMDKLSRRDPQESARRVGAKMEQGIRQEVPVGLVDNLRGFS